jgi:acyl carrier protein
MDAVELVMALEKELGVRISDKEAERSEISFASFGVTASNRDARPGLE